MDVAEILPLVTKPGSFRSLGQVDISQLVARVQAVSDGAWNAEDARKENAFPCFHHTRHLVFRFTPGNRAPQHYYANPSWDVWQGLLIPVMQAAIVGYGFEDPAFPKVMLARLDAGEAIDRHRDGAGSNERTHKIHVPLMTNPGALFEAGGKVLHLRAGEAYEVNNLGPHAAWNKGSEDRIHLIFEVYDAATLRREAQSPA